MVFVPITISSPPWPRNVAWAGPSCSRNAAYSGLRSAKKRFACVRTSAPDSVVRHSWSVRGVEVISLFGVGFAPRRSGGSLPLDRTFVHQRQLDAEGRAFTNRADEHDVTAEQTRRAPREGEAETHTPPPRRAGALRPPKFVEHVAVRLDGNPDPRVLHTIHDAIAMHLHRRAHLTRFGEGIRVGQQHRQETHDAAP